MMAMKIAARYANGVFTPETRVSLPEGASILMACEDGFAPMLPDGSPLAAAEREFVAAFANGGWDEARVREGSRMAWEAARESVARIGKARGWAYENANDLRGIISRLDEELEREESGGSRYFARFRMARTFRARATDEDEDVSMLLGSQRQFRNGLTMISRLIEDLDLLSCVDRRNRQ